jgi:hypothetical protein
VILRETVFTAPTYDGEGALGVGLKVKKKISGVGHLG